MLFFLLERPWSTLLLIFSIHKYLSYNHPEQYQKFCILCGYYAIYVFSKAQMIYLKLKPHINKVLEPCLENKIVQNMLQIFKEAKTNFDLEFVSNGNVIYRCLKEEILNESLFLPKNFDFIIYSEPSLETVYKKLLYSIPKNIEFELNIETCSYRFILFELNIGEEHIKIDFSTNQYNFYVENNIINETFLLYFLEKYSPEVFTKYSLDEIQKYKITYLDESFSVKEVEKNVGFLFKKNGFELIEYSKQVLDTILDNVFDNIKISDSIKFSNDTSDEEYADLPDLIPINHIINNETTCENNENENEYDDLPDLIPMDEN